MHGHFPVFPHRCTADGRVLSLNALHEKAFPRVKQNFSINHHGEAETGFAGDEMSFREDRQPRLAVRGPLVMESQSCLGEGFCCAREQVFALGTPGRALAAAVSCSNWTKALSALLVGQAPALALRLKLR